MEAPVVVLLLLVVMSWLNCSTSNVSEWHLPRANGKEWKVNVVSHLLCWPASKRQNKMGWRKPHIIIKWIKIRGVMQVHYYWATTRWQSQMARKQCNRKHMGRGTQHGQQFIKVHGNYPKINHWAFPGELLSFLSMVVVHRTFNLSRTTWTTHSSPVIDLINWSGRQGYRESYVMHRRMLGLLDYDLDAIECT